MQRSKKNMLANLIIALVIHAGFTAPATAADDQTATASPLGQEASDTVAGSMEQADSNRIIREGVAVEFTIHPTDADADQVIAADWADVNFRITDETTGEPIKGRYPAAWMDLGEAWEAKGERPMGCRQKVETYLKGIVGIRPMINLNDHFLLVMNRDASISVIDPAVGITGITNLFAQINLDHPGADWAKTEDQKKLFVSMPLANRVALVDTETFKVVGEVDAGEYPTRAMLQADERYLWVGNNASKAEQSGVTVIDTTDLRRLSFIQTGRGHHEIAFSGDDRYAFVTNRDSGTVSVIDVSTLKKVADLETGPVPISLAYSPLGNAIYVADGQAGTVSVVDPESLEIRKRIQAKPGLGPLRFSDDGRWGLSVNPLENTVFVFDAATEKLVHTIPAGKQPYQLNFTRSYVYIRSLGSELVGLIQLSELERKETPQVKYFPAGQMPPGKAAEISIANSIVPSVKEAAAYVVNQAEGTVHYYMEGMTAPMGAFRNYGHQARAIEIVDRSLSEQEPGLYTGRVKIPVEGIYDIAFMMDTPRFLHCFTAKVNPNPTMSINKGKLGVEYHLAKRMVPVGQTSKVKFKLIEQAGGRPMVDIPDVTVLYYTASGDARTIVPAKAIGDGFYEVDVKIDHSTTYYFFVGTRSAKVKYTDLPFASLMGMPATAAKPKNPVARP